MDSNEGPMELECSVAKNVLTSTRGVESIEISGWTVLVATPLRVFIGEARVLRRDSLVHMCLLICRKYFLQPEQNCKWRSDIVFSERG